MGCLVPNAIECDGGFIPVQPDRAHGYLVSTALVAKGFGVTRQAIAAARERHLDELLETVHWTRQQTVDASNREVEAVVWTKLGVITLGMFLRGPKAKAFRMAAAKLVLAYQEGSTPVSQAATPATPSLDSQLLPVLVDVVSTLKVLVERMGRLEAATGPLPVEELTVTVSHLTERQRSVLAHLEGQAKPHYLLGLDRELGVLHALERAGLARQTGYGWMRTLAGLHALTDSHRN